MTAPDATDSPLPIDAAIDAGFGPCLDDDFNDGSATDWTIVDPTWTVVPAEGPDSSSAFVASPNVGDHIITHPTMRALRRAHLALDFRMDNGATSDFAIYLVPPGWTDPNGNNQARYFVAIYVLGGDSGPNDRIVRSLPPVPYVEVATHAISVPARTWRHLDATYTENGSIEVKLDGSPYMTSPADTLLPGPLDLLVRFWANGAIDNVHLDCLR